MLNSAFRNRVPLASSSFGSSYSNSSKMAEVPRARLRTMIFCERNDNNSCRGWVLIKHPDCMGGSTLSGYKAVKKV